MTTSFDNDHPWQDRLSEYLDGTLTDAEVRSLEEHLVGCESCRAAIADLRMVVERLRGDQMDPVPPDAWSRIARRLTVQRLVNAPAGRERGSHLIAARTLRLIATAASLVVTLIGGVWIGAVLCMAQPPWSPPGWMHLRSRASTRDAAALLRQSLVVLDQELGEAQRAVGNQPASAAAAATAGRERVELLRRTRLRLQAALDSLTSTAGRERR
jgi:anti-sigma factor RsiW